MKWWDTTPVQVTLFGSIASILAVVAAIIVLVIYLVQRMILKKDVKWLEGSYVRWLGLLGFLVLAIVIMASIINKPADATSQENALWIWLHSVYSWLLGLVNRLWKFIQANSVLLAINLITMILNNSPEKDYTSP